MFTLNGTNQSLIDHIPTNDVNNKFKILIIGGGSFFKSFPQQSTSLRKLQAIGVLTSPHQSYYSFFRRATTNPNNNSNSKAVSDHLPIVLLIR